MSLLVLGGTGTLGRQVVRRALDEGFNVKCLVRNFRRASFLKEWGAELIYGDFKSPETIPLALVGITAVIDASTARPSDLYNASQVDLHGKNILIKAAQKALIKRYISFSIANADQYNNIPLMNFKLITERKLVDSGLKYTIFTLSGFFQGIISQYALPILEQKTVWVTKDMINISYIDTQDVARLTIKSLSINEAEDKIMPLAGHDSWTSVQIIELCEKLSGQKSRVSSVPVIILKIARQLASFFQWTWNIADRLAFTQVLYTSNELGNSMENLYDVVSMEDCNFNRLDIYLQEYFQKVMKKLKELNYKVKEETNDQLF